MSTKIMRLLAVMALASALTGCGGAFVRHELLPPASYVALNEKRVRPMVVIPPTGKMSAPGIVFAALQAQGNALADQALLTRRLTEEADKLNADVLVLSDVKLNVDQAVYYAGAVPVSTPLHMPVMDGYAFKYSKAILGIHYTRDGVVDYVIAGTPADRAGIKEGEKIVAINGKPFAGDIYIMPREITSKQPGDTVVIELLPMSGEKVKKAITLAPAPAH